MLGRRDHVRLRRVGHDNPALGGRVDIDVVHAHAGAAHRSQAPGASQELGVELGRRADQDPVVVADALGQLFPRPPHAQIDVEALAQQLDSRVADLLGHEHPSTSAV